MRLADKVVDRLLPLLRLDLRFAHFLDGALGVIMVGILGEVDGALPSLSDLAYNRIALAEHLARLEEPCGHTRSRGTQRSAAGRTKSRPMRSLNSTAGATQPCLH